VTLLVLAMRKELRHLLPARTRPVVSGHWQMSWASCIQRCKKKLRHLLQAPCGIWAVADELGKLRRGEERLASSTNLSPNPYTLTLNPKLLASSTNLNPNPYTLTLNPKLLASSTNLTPNPYTLTLNPKLLASSTTVPLPWGLMMVPVAVLHRIQ